MKLFSLKDISNRYGITIAMLKKLIQHNQITRVKVGNKNFISEDVMEEYIASNTITAEVA